MNAARPVCLATVLGLVFAVTARAQETPVAMQGSTQLSRMVASGAGAPPTGLRAEPTPSSIKIRWGCPEGASGYEVYATPAGGTQTKLTPTPIGLRFSRASGQSSARSTA